MDLDVTPRYPAAYDLDNILSVMALDANDQKTPNGSWGQASVDIGSPSTNGANSRATPHVAGVAGLLRTTPRTAAEHLKLTREKVAGLAKGLPVVGRWRSADGKLFYLAVGGRFNARGEQIR